jgi:hypothetical protein
MVEVDEYGLADVQKVSVAGYDIGFPLKAYQYAVGWTRRYLERATVGEVAANLVAAQAADIRNIKREILRALFRATNYTFIDRLTDGTSLPVKALQNADGAGIPMDQWGNTFNSATHTHLVGRAGGSLAASDISALVDNVTEHAESGELVIYIPLGLQTTVEGFTSNFKTLQAPLIDPGPGSTADVVLNGQKDNPYDVNDKLIGIWDGFVRVYVKPWMPANYILAYMRGGNMGGSALEYRRPTLAVAANFRLVWEDEHYPLRARTMEREFGIGVWNRLGAAILYTGGTSYVQPTLTF